MAPPDIQMRPSGVADAGRGITEAATAAKANIGKLFDSSESATWGNPGFAAAGALTTCAKAWEDRLGQLITRTAKTGQDLQTAATNATALDREAAERLNSVLGELKTS